MGCGGGVERTLAGDFCRGGVLGEEMFRFGDDMMISFVRCVCVYVEYGSTSFRCPRDSYISTSPPATGIQISQDILVSKIALMKMNNQLKSSLSHTTPPSLPPSHQKQAIQEANIDLQGP